MIASESGATVIKVSKPAKKILQKLPWPRFSIDKPKVPLGIDVIAKQQDIIKIVYKFFRVEDCSMDELLQEVFLAVIHKNQTNSAHDPRKSSFGHYVYMIANNVCINLVHKKKRYDRERDCLDSPCNDGKKTNLEMIEDKGFLNFEDRSHDPDTAEEFESYLRKKGMFDLARYVRAVRNGAKPEVIREALSWGDKKYSTKMIRDMRFKIKELVISASM